MFGRERTKKIGYEIQGCAFEVENKAYDWRFKRTYHILRNERTPWMKCLQEENRPDKKKRWMQLRERLRLRRTPYWRAMTWKWICQNCWRTLQQGLWGELCTMSLIWLAVPMLLQRSPSSQMRWKFEEWCGHLSISEERRVPGRVFSWLMGFKTHGGVGGWQVSARPRGTPEELPWVLQRKVQKAAEDNGACWNLCHRFQVLHHPRPGLMKNSRNSQGCWPMLQEDCQERQPADCPQQIQGLHWQKRQRPSLRTSI